MIGLAYFWRLATAIRKRQNGIVLHTATDKMVETTEAIEVAPLSSL
jgi:hypothetical protein